MISALGRILALTSDRTMRWIGLMSGTSGDGIDAALVEIDEPGGMLPRARMVTGLTIPFAAEFTRALLRDLDQGVSVEEAARWDARLGSAFADAALALIARVGPADALAVSGHTFSHLPRENPRATLQLGNPAVVAARTGTPVVAGFRAADVANGGEGAPLVPAGDRVLFSSVGCDVALLNLGGISNLTWLPGDGGDPRGRDAGPGNLILNRIVADATAGEALFDRDGAVAAKGRAEPALVARWLEHPFFCGEARSTGREEFGERWVQEHHHELRELSLEDRLATAVEWISLAVARCALRLGEGTRPGRFLAAGGGVHNRSIMRAIGSRAGPAVEVMSMARHGVDPDLREAACFAILGHLWLTGRSGSFPGTTGCRRAGPIGAIWTSN